MKTCPNPPHPLKNAPGTSQRHRLVEAIRPEHAPIDGASLADRLVFIEAFSKQINFYNFQPNTEDVTGRPQASPPQIGNWQSFFGDSLPFVMARLAKTDIDSLRTQLQKLSDQVQANPKKEYVRLLLDFVHFDLFVAVNEAYAAMNRQPNSLTFSVENAIRSKLRNPLINLVALSNWLTANLNLAPRKFTEFLQQPAWDINELDLFSKLQGGDWATPTQLQLRKVGTSLSIHGNAAIDALASIATEAPHFIQDALTPLQEEYQGSHPPHLGLLFAFLQIFEKFQVELNGLTQKHLAFFFLQVLGIKPRKAKPDTVHLVMEAQVFLEKYKVSKGTLMLDGKDEKKANVLFELDDELIVDKARVEKLMTLYRNPTTHFTCDDDHLNRDELAEGLYITTAANMADGIEEPFADGQAPNWPTLGDKQSKFVPKGKKSPQEHPAARMGFVLASPVLYLQEGQRKITFTLNCSSPFAAGSANDKVFQKLALQPNSLFHVLSSEAIKSAKKEGLSPKAVQALTHWLMTGKNHFEWTPPGQPWLNLPELTSPADQAILAKHTQRKFLQVRFSGEKGWVDVNLADPTNLTISISAASNISNFTMTVEAKLSPDQPAVSFFDKLALKEELGTELPLAAFYVDPDIKIACPNDFDCDPVCCLEGKSKEQTAYVSLHQIFSNVQLTDCQINVEVCGVRNLIVQNDETVQDVNAPILPFGARPDVPEFSVVAPPDPDPLKTGPSFFVGSREVMLKEWDDLHLNIEWKDLPTSFEKHYEAYQALGLPKNGFLIKAGVLSDGTWTNETSDTRELFADNGDAGFCAPKEATVQTIRIQPSDFPTGLSNAFKDEIKFTLDPLTVKSRNGFLRFKLFNQDFLHRDYPFVLARQMMAFGKFPAPVPGAVYRIQPTDPLAPTVMAVEQHYLDKLNELINEMEGDLHVLPANILDPFDLDIKTARRLLNGVDDNVQEIINETTLGDAQTRATNLKTRVDGIITNLFSTKDLIESIQNAGVPIPNEPYTPTIKSISLDYKAGAEKDEITFIHLYPYADTFKEEFVPNQPRLIAATPITANQPADPSEFEFVSGMNHPAEGSLFIGLKNLRPGSNLNLLIQLAESTADTESEKARVAWQYLRQNEWQDLRPGFEILEDATHDLNSSGIVKIAVPNDISNGPENTVLPRGLYWIKVAALANSKAVCQAVNLHAQAVRATAALQPENDTTRLAKALEPGKLNKFLVADGNIKQVQQPYESMGGRVAEVQKDPGEPFLTRVSERLRHKGRAISPFDYERLVLEEFPEIFKVKCIPHDLALAAKKYKQDLEWAAGYVTIAVLPNMNLLKAGDVMEPRAPQRLLQQIHDFLCERTSPFVRMRVFNPRYEPVCVAVQVQLHKGFDAAFYQEQLRTDIAHFLAPWYLGDSEKLRFGQRLHYSDVAKFIETLEYVNFITDLRLRTELECCEGSIENHLVLEPSTARSILSAGTVTVTLEEIDCPIYRQPAARYEPPCTPPAWLVEGHECWQKEKSPIE